MKIEDYNEYYIQGSDHYLIPKDVFNELFEELENWKQDAQKYKEIIDKLKKRLLELSYLNDELIDTELLDILNEVTNNE